MAGRGYNACMVPVAIGIGSNLGDPVQNVLNAAQALRERFGPVRLSPLYRTSPMYLTYQPDYINAAALFETSIGPRPLLQELKAMEILLGRAPSERYGPRLLDLDLLTYGALVLRAERIQIPHPRLHERLFVLRPLWDLEPSLQIPGQGIVSVLADPSFADQTVERVETHADF